jgi:hypothetical protein
MVECILCFKNLRVTLIVTTTQVCKFYDLDIDAFIELYTGVFHYVLYC